MELNDVIFVDNLPKLDLHGFDCAYANIKINEFIKNDLNRDFTYWDAKGGYDDSRTYIIYTALTKYELLRLERYMKTYDDHAFMVKSEGVGIKGEFEKKF